MRRRRIKPLLTRPKASHRSSLGRQSEPPKLPLQGTPVPRPHLRVRAPQRHPHVAVHDPDPIDTPSFSTPRPARKRRISETPLRPRRVSETPLPSASRTPAEQQVVDVIAAQPSIKRARVRRSPSLSGSHSVWANVANPSVSPVRSSALLASPGLLSAHVPLTIESVFSSDGVASNAPATLGTQRRISFGAAAERPSQDRDAQPQSRSPSPTKHIASVSAQNSDPPRGASPEAQPDISPEPTQRRLSSELPQQQHLPETSQKQPLADSPKLPSDACSPLFPPSQRSPLTPNSGPSQPSAPSSQPPLSSQPHQASLPPRAPTKSPSTTGIQGMKRFRDLPMSLSAGNSICSWAGEMDSPSSAALNVFRKPKQRSNNAPLHLRGQSPARCTPSAPSQTIGDPPATEQPKRTPARLKRDPVTTDDFEQLIPETPLQPAKEAAQEVQLADDALHAEDRIEERNNATYLKRGACMGIGRSVSDNEVEDDCSSTQSPSSADLRDDSTQNTKAQNAAVYCRSVLVSVPSGALRSFDNSDSPQ